MLKYIPLLFSLLLVGCVRYEYDITRPVELTAHIGTKTDTVASRPPLEYKLITADSRLVMRIYNNTDETIQLVGERSSVVDPAGQSHPLRGQSLAAHSFVKLIFPPIRPTIQRNGPSFGIGVGTVIGRNDRRRGIDDDFYDDRDEPRYLTIVDDDSLYWNWDGEGEIRLLLTFQRGEKTFDHEFVIARRKV